MLFNTSCDESFLDKEPTLDLSEDKIYTDATRLNATLEGIYYTLKRGEFMGGKSYIAFDNRGNDIKNTESNAVLLTETYSMSVGITDAENSNFWYYAYLTINRANIFIDR